MQGSDRQVIKELFGDALELSGEERAAFLERECPDATTRAAVESLLAAAASPANYLNSRLGQALQAEAGSPPEPEADAPDPMLGRTVGPYRLEAFLGRGGMGSVYRGERADGQFQQRVAIKLLSVSSLDPDSHRRFLAEREILARLQHANIARLFDGGITAERTPYFVMEFVDGAHIDRHCDERSLDITARLGLFLQVCEAVAHAHEHGVVHRDIKPANILVADGQVRLLDFGIAKFMAEEEDGARERTATGRAPMTLAYAAPEQLRGEPVTRATDVYALGVVLHELLTGLSPYQARTGSGMEMMRAVCEEDVTRPSTRLRGSGARRASELETIARARQTSMSALSRRMRGDLDTILLQALAKDPERRHASVRELAEDLRRHVEGRPIRARGASWSYRLGRALGRHPTASVATVAVALLLIALAVTARQLSRSSSRAARAIADERENARSLLRQLEELYVAADPSASPESAAAARPLIDGATRRLREDPPRDAAMRATLSFSAGRVYARLGAREQARPLLEESLALRRELLEAPHEELAASLFLLGSIDTRTGALEDGLPLLREALAMERELHGDDGLHVAQLRYAIASALHDEGDHGGAQREFLEAVRVFRLNDSEPSGEHIEALLALGDFMAVSRGPSEAVELFEEARELSLQLFGQLHPSTARALHGLGMLYYHTGRRQESAELLREAVRIDREVYGAAGHPELAMLLQNCGAVLATEGQLEGVTMLEEATAMYRASDETPAVTLSSCLTGLGNAYRDHDRWEDARDTYEESLAISAAGEVAPMFRVETQLQLARLLRRRAPSERAVELLESALAAYSALPADHPRVSELRSELEAARGR